MDAQETRIYTAVLITAIVFGGIVLFFIISIIRQQRKNLNLHKQNILAQITGIERDRARIAHDIHDELGPLLSSIKLRINNFELTDGDDKIQIEKINYSIDKAVIRIREISHDLMPADLLSTGLVMALREYITGISSAVLHIDFTSPRILNFQNRDRSMFTGSYRRSFIIQLNMPVQRTLIFLLKKIKTSWSL